MASLSGSFPALPRPRLSWPGFALALLVGLLGPNLRAEMPAYLHSALAAFNPDMPAGWAYTLATTRNNRTLVERFDPAKPAAASWTLVQNDSRTPTEEELEKYRRARSAAPGGTQPNFAKADIDPGSMQLLQDSPDQAVYRATFRDAATGADKMLGHLQVTLTIDKKVPFVAAYILELKEPYSPILGVKMHELRVEAHFSPPATDRPSLLLDMTSHFAGRIFLISTGEDLLLRFSDHQLSPKELSR